MGVDTHVRLPHSAQIQEVCEVMGILMGLKPVKMPLEQNLSDKWYVRVPNAEALGNKNIPQMATLQFNANKGEKLVDGLDGHSAYFHYEFEVESRRLLSVRSTPFWIALSRRLARFFGGEVIYNDCDGKICYRNPKHRKIPSNGKPWQDYQQEVFNLKPLTKQEIDKCRKWAAYQ